MLGPRQAVIAGVIGFVVVAAPIHYLYWIGYYLGPLSPDQWKNIGTAASAAAFAIPYLAVKWLLGRRKGKG